MPHRSLQLRFADPEAAALHGDLTGWFTTHAAPVLSAARQ
jgi:hypothetical protein